MAIIYIIKVGENNFDWENILTKTQQPHIFRDMHRKYTNLYKIRFQPQSTSGLQEILTNNDSTIENRPLRFELFSLVK